MAQLLKGDTSWKILRITALQGCKDIIKERWSTLHVQKALYTVCSSGRKTYDGDSSIWSVFLALDHLSVSSFPVIQGHLVPHCPIRVHVLVSICYPGNWRYPPPIYYSISTAGIRQRERKYIPRCVAITSRCLIFLWGRLLADRSGPGAMGTFPPPMADVVCQSDNEPTDNPDRPEFIRLPLLASASVDRMYSHSLSPSVT